MNFPFPGRPGTNYQNPVRTFPYPGPEVFGSTYRPGEFVSSGRLANVPSHPLIPDVFEFNLTFDTPGSYAYLCLTHADQMPGTVEVLRNEKGEEVLKVFGSPIEVFRAYGDKKVRTHQKIRLKIAGKRLKRAVALLDIPNLNGEHKTGESEQGNPTVSPVTPSPTDATLV
jgi:hypothetical protein